MSAPTKVIGRLRSRPTTAAAKPFRARRVSWVDVNPVCPTSGAMRTPASAASMKPSTQPICDIRYGLAPASATSSGSSTTARMATPSRARRRKTPSATPDHRRHDHDHDLLVLERDAVGPEQADRQHRSVRLREVGRHGADDVGAAPEDGGHAEQNHQEAERHHERPFHRRAVDAAEEHELDHEGEERRLDEDDERDGEQERPVLVLPQLPVRERGHHAHRALGEIEDAGGVVGHDQADGQEAVDGTEHDAEDREGEEVLTPFTSSPPENPDRDRGP